jgi:hypothetical protein
MKALPTQLALPPEIPSYLLRRQLFDTFSGILTFNYILLANADYVTLKRGFCRHFRGISGVN